MPSSFYLHVTVLSTLFAICVPLVSAVQICGKIGTNNVTLPFYMGNFFFKAQSTFALCADFCKNDFPRCKSFRYSYYSDADAQYCEFYADWMENYFIEDSTQPYYYYDIDCGFPTYAVTIYATATTTVRVSASAGAPNRTTTITSTSILASNRTTTITTTKTLPSSTTTTTASITKTLTSITTTTATAFVTSLIQSKGTTLTKTSTLTSRVVATITASVKPSTTTVVKTITSTKTK